MADELDLAFAFIGGEVQQNGRIKDDCIAVRCKFNCFTE